MAIDRELRAKVIFCAEAYERRTKAKGNRAGALMPSGLQLLRTIAFRFMNLAKGAAWPSYDKLCAVTGLCRASVAGAIRRLEEAGFLLVTRRAHWEAGRLVKLTNLYMLPITAPPMPADHESLLGERHSQTQEYAWGASPLCAALESLSSRIEQASSG